MLFRRLVGMVPAKICRLIVMCSIPIAIIITTVYLAFTFKFGIYINLLYSTATLALFGILPMNECFNNSIANRINFAFAVLSAIHATACMILIPVHITNTPRLLFRHNDLSFYPTDLIPHFTIILSLSLIWVKVSYPIAFGNSMISNASSRNTAKSFEKIEQPRAEISERPINDISNPV